MSFSIPIPDGFLEDFRGTTYSFITWDGSAEVNNGNGASDGTFHRQKLLPTGGKLREAIRPHPKGGTLSITITMNYKLFRPGQGHSFQLSSILPELVEQSIFSFGCDWPYSFSKGKVIFGPYQQWTSPPSRGFKLLQASYQDIQSKDQAEGGVLPYVYASPQWTIKSLPGDASTISFQAPIIGGPSYTPAPGPATPDGGSRSGGFWIELSVQSVEKGPEPKIDLDPNLFQLTLFLEKENQADISDATFLKLRDWINAIKRSNLYLPLKKRFLPLHMRGHASGSGTALYDQDLSTTRRLKVQRRIESMIDGNIEVIPYDRGKEDANPKNPRNYVDRNVTIYIDDEEAQDALDRYTESVKTP